MNRIRDAGTAAIIFLGLVSSACRGARDEVPIERFAPGHVSTPAIESEITFTPDGKTIYLARREGIWGKAPSPSVILVSRSTETGWTPFETAPFSGTFDDSDPFVSPDGRSLYFISVRPAPGKPEADPDLWRVERGEGGWGAPQRLPEPVNSKGEEFSPVVTSSGNLYFASTREGGRGQGDLYVARAEGGGFREPENLGPAFNTPTGEWNLLVSPDEGLLLFEASGRGANLSGAGDLYAAFRSGTGWSSPVNLRFLNTKGSELYPRLSPDGRDLYFASTGRGDGTHTDIFRVPLTAVLAAASR